MLFICRFDVLFYTKIYICCIIFRYANTNDVKRAFIDIEAALNIDPQHEKACKQMSVLLVSVARK